jgi:hypothetical protein
MTSSTTFFTQDCLHSHNIPVIYFIIWSGGKHGWELEKVTNMTTHVGIWDYFFTLVDKDWTPSDVCHPIWRFFRPTRRNRFGRESKSGNFDYTFWQ